MLIPLSIGSIQEKHNSVENITPYNANGLVDQ